MKNTTKQKITPKAEKNKKIIIPILNDEYRVIVVIGSNDFMKKVAYAWYYPDDRNYELPEDCRGVCYNRHECHPIIHLPNYPKTADEMGTLAHEAVHAINHIFDKISDMNRDGEVFAHSVSAVVKGVLNHVKK